MLNTPEAERNAPLIQRATGAMLDELLRIGVADNAAVCLAAVGTIMGALAATCGNPEEALAGMNTIARGIIDGSLLDEAAP